MSGLVSHVSRSVALSMLGYRCLAHSYWQRCHKTGLWGAVSGEEETVEELTRRGPYACPVDCFPQAVSLSLPAHPSLHRIIHSFAPALSARTSDFLELSVCPPRPQIDALRDRRSVRRSSWWSWKSKKLLFYLICGLNLKSHLSCPVKDVYAGSSLPHNAQTVSVVLTVTWRILCYVWELWSSVWAQKQTTEA